MVWCLGVTGVCYGMVWCMLCTVWYGMVYGGYGGMVWYGYGYGMVYAVYGGYGPLKMVG